MAPGGPLSHFKNTGGCAEAKRLPAWPADHHGRCRPADWNHSR